MNNVSYETIYLEYPVELIDYGFITFAFHFSNFCQHIFIDKRGKDFYEMLLHHGATACLYCCYNLGNMVPIGTVIVLLHDIVELPVCSAKCLSSTVMQTSAAIAGFLVVGVWFWTRVLAF